MESPADGSWSQDIFNFQFLSLSINNCELGSHKSVITLPALGAMVVVVGGMVVVEEGILLGLEDSRVEVEQPL